MKLPERIEEINMDPEAVREQIKKISGEFEKIGEISERTKNNLVALEGNFKSGNYIRAAEAIGSVRAKMTKAEVEFDELIRSCDSLVKKVEEITKR